MLRLVTRGWADPGDFGDRRKWTRPKVLLYCEYLDALEEAEEAARLKAQPKKGTPM